MDSGENGRIAKQVPNGHPGVPASRDTPTLRSGSGEGSHR